MLHQKSIIDQPLIADDDPIAGTPEARAANKAYALGVKQGTQRGFLKAIWVFFLAFAFLVIVSSLISWLLGGS